MCNSSRNGWTADHDDSCLVMSLTFPAEVGSKSQGQSIIILQFQEQYIIKLQF